MTVIVAVVVAAIVLLIIAIFAGWIKGFGAEALGNLWNVGKYIDCLIHPESCNQEQPES